MKKAFLSGQNNVFILFFSFLIIFSGFALFYVFSLTSLFVFDISLEEFKSIFEGGIQDNNIGLFKYLQIIQGITIFIVPAIFIGYFINRSPIKYLQFKKGVSSQLLFLAVVTIVFSAPLVNVFSYVNQQLHLPGFLSGVEEWMLEKEKYAETISVSYLRANSIWGLLINILMMAVLPALGEEMIFRGVFQNQFMKMFKNKHVAVFAAALIFGLVHFQFFTLLPRIFLGLYLGYLFLWTGNLWYPIIAHFVNNSIIVIIYYVYSSNVSNLPIDKVGTTNETTWYGVASLIIVSACLYLIYKWSSTLSHPDQSFPE